MVSYFHSIVDMFTSVRSPPNIKKLGSTIRRIFFFELSIQIKCRKKIKHYSHKLWFLFKSPSCPVTIKTHNKDQ